MFDFYGKDGFTNFGNVPTWKRASPHNIQRRTWQAANCNHCHGNRALFLSSSDLLDYEKQANKNVVVPDGKVPKPVEKTQKLVIDTSKVQTGKVVDARWLNENLGKKNVVVVDARDRAAYDKGHIEGAVSLDPMTSGFRTGPDADKPFTLVSHEQVAAILGRAGLAAEDHIIVYDQSGVMATAFLALLEWAGATHVSYLDGGIEEWHAAGFHTSTEPSVRKARSFSGTVKPEFVVDSETLFKLLGRRNVVVLDGRAIDRILGDDQARKGCPGRTHSRFDQPAARLAHHGQRCAEAAGGATVDAQNIRHHPGQDRDHHLRHRRCCRRCLLYTALPGLPRRPGPRRSLGKLVQGPVIGWEESILCISSYIAYLGTSCRFIRGFSSTATNSSRPRDISKERRSFSDDSIVCLDEGCYESLGAAIWTGFRGRFRRRVGRKT